ncbi:hypothetical protein GmHk_18G052651 [Glycine max]|nr:hypothetical protein GmHk_18G052651 [Glycine max]
MEKNMAKELVNCTLSGHVSLHSGDINALSNLLLDSSFGLNQVYCLPTVGTSNTSISSIHSLNSCILLSPSSLSVFPLLSFGFLMQLKSPSTHHNLTWDACFSCLTESHNILSTSLMHSPSKKMNPFPMTLFCSLKAVSVHMHKMPPAELFAGCISHMTSSLPHIA